MHSSSITFGATAILALVLSSANARAEPPVATIRLGGIESASEPFRPLATPTPDTTIFGLPKNIGVGDRVLRGFVAGTLLGIGTYGLASGDINQTLSGVLMAVSVVPGATAATGYCPVYQVLGIDTSF